MDDELIRWCALATRAACLQMTAPHLKALQDSVGQARSLPARFAWDRKAIVHTEILNLLTEAVTDRPGTGPAPQPSKTNRRNESVPTKPSQRKPENDHARDN